MGCLQPKRSDGGDDALQSGTERKLKIVMVGLEGSGKTSILYYLKNQTFIQT